ncbi:MAG: hypothetical protein CUN56_09835 [Phototrophicales bacterium]|nr:MAG: hypothetical protein CUN56_09835 [Phototrophicales bacterium]
MPTLQDVAKHAGVSTATVSKVLSNTPYFTEETRQKVMEAVKALGYRPNLAARALSSGKTHIIAVVFPYIYDAIFKDPLVMHILEGIEAASTAKGYNILLSTPRLNTDGPEEAYMQLIQSGYIEGMIAIDNVPMASVGMVAEAQHIPVVSIGYHPAAYSVRSDDETGGKLAFEHVYSLGHRRIGIITVEHGINFAIAARLKGLYHAAQDYEISPADLPIAFGNFSTQSGAKAAEELLGNHPDLTALLCLNDRMAVGAIQYINQIGRSVPDDITVIGYDNIALSAVINPPLTTIDQHPGKLGEIAFDMLMDVLNGETPTSVVLPPDLIIRGSDAAPR